MPFLETLKLEQLIAEKPTPKTQKPTPTKSWFLLCTTFLSLIRKDTTQFTKDLCVNLFTYINYNFILTLHPEG